MSSLRESKDRWDKDADHVGEPSPNFGGSLQSEIRIWERLTIVPRLECHKKEHRNATAGSRGTVNYRGMYPSPF